MLKLFMSKKCLPICLVLTFFISTLTIGTYTPVQKVFADTYTPKLPKTVAATSVVVLDISKDKGATKTQLSCEALLAIRTIQGIVNRTSSEKIYLTHNQLAWADVWSPPDVDTFNLTDGLVPVTKTYPTLDNNKQFPVLSYLLQNYSSYITGKVKIQSGAGDSGPVMAALTACAQLNAIPVTPDIATYVTNEGLNLPVLADTTGITDGITAYHWAKDNYFNSSTTRAYIGKFSFNDWGDDGKAINYDPLDYYITTKAFIMDLNANNPTENTLIGDLLNPTNYSPGTPVLGSADGEGMEISRLNELGYTFSFFDGGNFSVHSSFASNPSAITPSTPTAPATIDNNAAYVSFYVTDGDAFGISQFFHRDYWRNSPNAGQVPIGWSISPMVFDLFPNLISYYSNNDYNNNYELISNYCDGPAPRTTAGATNFIANYKYYLENTNGAFKMMNYFDLGPNAEYNVSAINPYGCIFGYQGDSGGNPVLFKTLNNNYVTATNMSGQTQVTTATNMYDSAKYVVDGTAAGTPAFVMVCAGDGAHSGDVPAKVKAAVDMLNANSNGRNYQYLKPSDLVATWRKSQGLQIIPPTPAPTPTPEVAPAGKVDNTDSTVYFNGTWSSFSSFANYHGSVNYSNDTGGNMQYTFTGTGIQWIGNKESNDGKANVYIDGVLDASNIDLYSYPNKCQQVLYSKTGLSNGSHIIMIVPTGTKNASSFGTTITIDALQVTNGGATPTPTPSPTPTPAPGTLLSQGKTASASNEYDSAHNAAKAVDGIADVPDNTKWCTTTPVSTSWLQVDLSQSCNISRYVVKHCGILEDPTLNTRDFKFQVSSDGTTWSDIDTVAGNTANITDHNVTANGKRYARLYITNPQTNTNWIGARIYEFQVYGSVVGTQTLLSQGKTATASNIYDSAHNAAKAVDGIADGLDNTKWCTTTPVSTSWLQVDLGQTYNITRYVVYHCGILEDPTFNTRDFKFQISNNGTTWTDLDSVIGNTANITDKSVSATSARYARLYITNPQTNLNWIGARIYEFQVYGS